MKRNYETNNYFFILFKYKLDNLLLNKNHFYVNPLCLLEGFAVGAL